MSLFVNLPLREHRLCIAKEHIYSGKDFPFHYHPEIEITYVFRSHGLRIVGDSFESYEKDDLVAIGSNVPHQWKKDVSFKKQGGDQEHIIVVHIHAERLSTLVNTIRELQPLKSLLNEIRSGVIFSKKTALSVRPLLKKLVEEDGVTSFVTLLELLNALVNDKGRRMLANRMLKPTNSGRKGASNEMREVPGSGGTPDTTQGNGGMNPRSESLDRDPIWRPEDTADGKRIFGIVEHLLSHHHLQIRAADLAGEMNMSPSAFSHYFKKRTARTFRAYLNDIRLSHACKLLQQSEKPVAEICFECGFNTISNFNRVFKAAYRRSPREYRAQTRRAE